MSEELQSTQQVEEVTENPTVEEPATKPEAKTVTMTQDELNALIVKEKGRVKNKYADYDDLKAKLAEYESKSEEQKRAEMSEIERLQADLKAKEEAEQTLAQQLQALKEQAQAEKIRNRFNEVASSNHIAYLDDAYGLADLSAVTIGEDGKVVGIEEAVKGLVEHKPYLVAKKEAKPVGESTNGASEVSTKTAQQLLQEAADKAKRTQKVEDIAAYSKLKRELSI